MISFSLSQNLFFPTNPRFFPKTRDFPGSVGKTVFHPMRSIHLCTRQNEKAEAARQSGDSLKKLDTLLYETDKDNHRRAA